MRYVIVGTTSELMIKVWGLFRSEMGAKKYARSLEPLYGMKFDLLVCECSEPL